MTILTAQPSCQKALGRSDSWRCPSLLSGFCVARHDVQLDEHPRPTSNVTTPDRPATRRASSASPERSDADSHPIPFQVTGGAMDQTSARPSFRLSPTSRSPCRPSTFHQKQSARKTGCLPPFLGASSGHPPTSHEMGWHRLKTTAALLRLTQLAHHQNLAIGIPEHAWPDRRETETTGHPCPRERGAQSRVPLPLRALQPPKQSHQARASRLAR